MSEQQPKKKSSWNHWKVCYDLWRLRPIESEESSTSRTSCVRIGEKMSLAGRRFRKFTMALDTDIVKDDRIHFRWKHQCCRRAALNSALHILFHKRWTRRGARRERETADRNVEFPVLILFSELHTQMDEMETSHHNTTASSNSSPLPTYGLRSEVSFSSIFNVVYQRDEAAQQRRRKDEWIERNTQERKPKDSTFA